METDIKGKKKGRVTHGYFLQPETLFFFWKSLVPVLLEDNNIFNDSDQLGTILLYESFTY